MQKKDPIEIERVLKEIERRIPEPSLAQEDKDILAKARDLLAKLKDRSSMLFENRKLSLNRYFFFATSFNLQSRSLHDSARN